MNTPAPMTVEEWLAQGNKPKELPIGFTHYPDGVIPKNNSRTIDELESKRKAIEEKNAQIRKAKEEAKAAARAEAEKRKQLRKAESLRRKQEEKAKREAERKLKALEPKPPVLKLVKFREKTENYWRREIISMQKRSAMARGENKFHALCTRHGLTEYIIYKDKAACMRCRSRETRGYSEEHFRRQRINEARRQAIENGQDTFMGECKNHGLTVYTVIHDGKSECRECRIQSNKMTYEKERHRRKLLRAANRDKAKEAGKRFFKSDCEKHGITLFRIKNCGYAECIECKREYDQKRGTFKTNPRLEYSLENDKRRAEALERGENRFMGLCRNHGETLYAANKSKPLYACLRCKTESTAKSIAMNKERNLSHPRTLELIEWLKSNPVGEQVRLAAAIGIAAQSLNHYVKGRGIMPDNRYSQFLEYKKQVEDNRNAQ